MLRKILKNRVERVHDKDIINEDSGILRHQGPYFHTVEIELSKDEILTLYKRVHESYHNKTFWKNFSHLCMKRGWIKNPNETKKLLNSYLPTIINKQIHDISESYKHCIVDGGKKEPITNWRMEPPIVFLGRGEHPLRGCLKRRIVPEDVTLNLDVNAPVPTLPRGRRWAAVIHKPDCQWLWSWVDPLLNKWKYVYPAAVSGAHAETEKLKFEDAMNLGEHIENIRRFYNQSLRRGEYIELSCIIYLIDHLGIRIGNENNSNVVGASTLCKENISFLPNGKRIRVRFNGKDSVEYDNQLSCSTDFIRSIEKLSEGKNGDEQLFPNVTPKVVNEYIQSHHPSLTAKTFRTYNATMKMKEALEEYRARVDDPVEYFRRCATEVAIFCNHKKISTLRKSREQYSPSTTITNYIDPRVVVKWADKNNIPIEKLYPKSLRERFSWAIRNSKDNTYGSE